MTAVKVCSRQCWETGHCDQSCHGSIMVLTEDEQAYAHAYSECLTVGDVNPLEGDLDPDRAEAIRTVIDGAWRERVARMRRPRR